MQKGTEKMESDQREREYFLRFIRRLGNAAVLLEREASGRFALIFASRQFARMMECDDEPKGLMGYGFLKSTHPDDIADVERVLGQRSFEAGQHDLTVRKITAKGNTIWCNVHYTFLDDFGKNYIYCTYFDVTLARMHEERLRKAYTSIGEKFYRESDRTKGMFRVNLSRDRIEDMRGKDTFPTDSTERSYSDVIRLRAEHYPIAE